MLVIVCWLLFRGYCLLVVVLVLIVVCVLFVFGVWLFVFHVCW